jgi:potassium/hydrogen antiporter
VLLAFGSSVLVSAWLLELIADLDFRTTILLAVALAAVSAPIVVPIVSRMAPGSDVASLLTLEASIADALAVVIATTMLHAGPGEGLLATNIASGIGQAAVVGLIAGLVVGLAWLWALTTLARGRYPFTLTLGCLLVLMGAVELVEGSGAMAILAFGITLANGSAVDRVLPTRVRERIAANLPGGLALEPRIHHLLGEATLLTRTFFFIYLGAVMRWPGWDARFWIVLGLLVAGIVLSRALSVFLFRLVFPTAVRDRRMILAMVPRGLATAVLAALAAQGQALAIDPIALALGVILASNLMMTLLVRRAGAAPAPTQVEPVAA